MTTIELVRVKTILEQTQELMKRDMVEFDENTARQSSNSYYPAICAINPKHKLCVRKGADKSYTNEGLKQWWQVGFLYTAVVSEVKILQNNANKGGHNEVYIDDQLCGRYPSNIRGKEWITVTCPAQLFGKMIKIVSTTETNVCLSGIEVYGIQSSHEITHKVSSGPPPPGLAELDYSTAKMSSNPTGRYGAICALNPKHKTCGRAFFDNSYSKCNVGEYWQVGFRHPYTVAEVEVLQKFPGRGSGNEVYIGKELCGKYPTKVVTRKPFKIKCSKPIKGNMVKIVTTRRTNIALSSVKVYATSVDEV